MATVSVPTRRTVAGESVEGMERVEVADAVAKLLKAREPETKEALFADLDGRRPGDDEDAPSIDSRLTEADGERHRSRRQTAVGSDWEGPRLRFTHIIGATEIWNGPPEQFEFCKGRRLRSGEVCLDCHRTGDELRIPAPPPRRPSPLAALMAGDGLKGGKDGPRRRKRKAKGGG